MQPLRIVRHRERPIADVDERLPAAAELVARVGQQVRQELEQLGHRELAVPVDGVSRPHVSKVSGGFNAGKK